MKKSQTQEAPTIEIKFGPAKGIYTVHPAAQVFPLLTREKYAELKASIQEFGQQEPIVLHEGMFLDGRNRINVLNELGREPRIAEFGDFGSNLHPGVWVMTRNLQRRHLTDDQYIVIFAKYQEWCEEENEGQRLEFESNKEGKVLANTVAEVSNPDEEAADNVGEIIAPQFPQEPAEKNSSKKRGRKPGMRSKVVALASATGQSRYRAEQAVKVRQSPELAVAVEERRMSLKDAAVASQQANSPSETHDKNFEAAQHRTSSAVFSAEQWLRAKAKSLPSDQRKEFWETIVKISNQALSLM